MSEPDRLSLLLQVEPPPELDRCVRQRLLAAVEAERAVTPGTGREGIVAALVRSDATAPGAAVALPLAERCVYVLGLLGYGAHALTAMARLVWRAVVG